MGAPRYQQWEDEIIIALYPILSVPGSWTNLLPSRTDSGIRYRSKKLKTHALKRYTDLRNQQPYKDLTGKIFGKWKVLGRAGRRGGWDAWYWLSECSCGNTKEVNGRSLVSGASASCGCVNGNQLPDGEAAFNSLYSSYKRKAIERGYSFGITKEEFREITKGDCCYCGVPPRQETAYGRVCVHTGEYIYNGLDRTNNDRGYSMENIRPCCVMCNRMKTSHTEKAFLSQVAAIYKQHNKNA